MTTFTGRRLQEQRQTGRVGMNGTRALTCKYNAQLSCGRVQTPTLAIIAMREEEIRSFKPKEYFGITVNAGDITWTWKDRKSGSFRTFSRERAEEIIEKVKAKRLPLLLCQKSRRKHMRRDFMI